MLYSCQRFQTMSADELADILTQYVTFVRSTGTSPGGPAAWWTEIQRYTDTVVAPPPGTGAGEGLRLVTRSPVPAA